MTIDEPRIVWVTDKGPVSSRYEPRKIDSYVSRREVVKETPKGLRLKMSDTWASFHSAERYNFFDTELEALEFVRAEADAVIDKLIKRRQQYQSLYMELGQAIGNIK